MNLLTNMIINGMDSTFMRDLQERVNRLPPETVERDKNLIFRDNRVALEFLRDITGSGIDNVKHYFDDLLNDDEFYQEVSGQLVTIAGNNAICEFKFLASFLYVIVRALRPEVVVETGVASGKSSLYLLKGMQDNGKGRLYSIDLPPDPRRRQQDSYLISLPTVKDVGWLVSSSLRDRWELILGDVRIALPGLLSKLESIDFFFHDSLHTYEHMLFEFNSAYQYLRTGGVIWADNVNHNDAYADFIVSNGLKPCFFRQTGGVRKILK